MCGIFGQISNTKINKFCFDKLIKHSEQRGVDSSGLVYYDNGQYKITRAKIVNLIPKLYKEG